MKIIDRFKSLFTNIGIKGGKVPNNRSEKSYKYHNEAYPDQKMLLTNTEVNIIFDVGSYIGDTVQEYHNLFPKSRIYSFEPLEETYNTLSEKFKDNNHIKTYNLAIAKNSGSKKFYVNKANYTNSLLEVADTSKIYIDTNLTDNLRYVNVETISLDDFCKRENIEKINILKMDIQGAELMALHGATNLLKTRTIDIIYLEVEFVKLYDDQAYFNDIHEYLTGYGYILFGLYDLRYGKNNVFAWCDALYISPKLNRT